jgi:surface carbohydrate biosynthesis protein
MSYRILYLPIETQNREFIGKLLLAARAAQKNFVVYIGQKGRTVRESMVGPPGTVIEISIPTHKEERMKGYQANGHLIANMCEESISYPDGHDYCERKVGEETLPYLSRFFAIGQRQADHISAFRETSPDQVVITGSHRVDLLRREFRDVYTKDADRIREEFGSFILEVV